MELHTEGLKFPEGTERALNVKTSILKLLFTKFEILLSCFYLVCNELLR